MPGYPCEYPPEDYQFWCSGGYCIPKGFGLCNAEIECPSGEDEDPAKCENGDEHASKLFKLPVLHVHFLLILFLLVATRLFTYFPTYDSNPTWSK